MATRYRWNQEEMDLYLKSYLDEWNNQDYFASGKNLGNFNRELYGIKWNREMPKSSSTQPMPQYDSYEPVDTPKP